MSNRKLSRDPGFVFPLMIPVSRQTERVYSEEDIVDLLNKAIGMGLALEKGSCEEQMSLGELERLITRIV